MTNPIIHQFQVQEKVVAFTFDDGPNPIYTPQVLEIFNHIRGKATFFMIGNQIEQQQELAQIVHRQGHEIGNHTYTHPFLTKLSQEEAVKEIQRMDELITKVTGVKPRCFRPPYFDYNDQIAAIAKEQHYFVAGAANGEAMDWEQPGVQHIIDKTLESMAPGNVLLFHDGFGDRSQTIEAVSQLVSLLDQKGYRFVTFSELADLASQA